MSFEVADKCTFCSSTIWFYRCSSVLDHQGSFGTKTTQEESLTVEFSPRCSTEGSEELSWRQIPPPSDDSARSSLSEARKIPAEEKEKSEEVLSEKSAESSARLSSKSKHCYKEEVVMQYLWQSTNLPPYRYIHPIFSAVVELQPT